MKEFSKVWRLALIELRLVACAFLCLVLTAAPFAPAFAEKATGTQQPSAALASGVFQKKQKDKGWSRRQKILVSVAAGCMIATAIAVPVACGVHAHIQQRHHQAYRRALVNLIRNREAADLQQEQSLNALLMTGTLNPGQRIAVQKQIQTLNSDINTLEMDTNVRPAVSAGVEVVVAAH